MAEITWKSILTKLVGGDHLSAEESEWFVDDLMNGNANPAAVGAVLATQQQLGLTPDEVRGAAKAMVAHAIPLHIEGETTDIVGTGGDGASTVNLSSMGAIVAAAAGVKIVKHGNRAASSKCGTADCFEALGLPLDLTPEQVAEVGNECGIAFAFARTFHPAMRFVGPIRAALGVPCVFNVLGPLTNREPEAYGRWLRQSQDEPDYGRRVCGERPDWHGLHLQRGTRRDGSDRAGLHLGVQGWQGRRKRI